MANQRPYHVGQSENTRFELLGLVLTALSGSHSTQLRQGKLLKYDHRAFLTVSRFVFAGRDKSIGSLSTKMLGKLVLVEGI